MRYQGGKSRIATPLAQILNSAGGDCFVSLFCGSCSVESKVTGYNRIILNDKHEYLIQMLKGVQSGYELPEMITEDQYQRIKANKDADPVLAGFVGFGCSFGGKWFGGYARNKGGTNYAAQSKRSLLKDLSNLLIENNVMVLPCKVGDTVYILSDNEIFECFLKDILTYKALDYKLEISRNFNGEINGKQTVFLTKEAAENALKGLNIE